MTPAAVVITACAVTAALIAAIWLGFPRWHARHEQRTRDRCEANRAADRLRIERHARAALHMAAEHPELLTAGKSSTEDEALGKLRAELWPGGEWNAIEGFYRDEDAR